MKQTWILLLCLLLASACAPAGKSASEADAGPLRPGGPRLVVVLVVDQMLNEHLTRYGELYDGGLKRLVDNGAWFTEAHHGHALTLTAPGHASLSTAMHPARNGVVSNDWWDRTLQRRVYSVEGPAEAGGTPSPLPTPHHLLSDTLGDWLKRHSPQSQVHAVSIKDRSAILLGGQQPDGAYWYEAHTGRFSWSPYYGSTLPDWVAAWNERSPAERYFGSLWERLLDEPAYELSREDAFAAEADGTHTVFPHGYLGETADGEFFGWLRSTPFADALMFDFVREMIDACDLGGDDAPDLLWIGASSSDAIGHIYGPFSQEAQDYYLRLDRDLAELFKQLDDRVGAENYLFALTSDHGVLALPEFLGRDGIRARRLDTDIVGARAAEALNVAIKAVGVDYPIDVQFLNGLVLTAPAQADEETLRKIRAIMQRELRKASFIEDVYTYDELLDPATPDRPYLEQYRRSIHPERAPDLFLRLNEHNLMTRSRTQTTHGSPYPYDTRVPLLLLGPTIEAGRIDEPVETVDLAVSLAHLIGFAAPADRDGSLLPGLR